MTDRTQQSNPSKPKAATDSALWQDFHREFAALASEETVLLQGTLDDRGLEAHSDYTAWTKEDRKRYKERGWELPVPDKSAYGYWILRFPRVGPYEHLHAQFEDLATRAGLALGVPKGVKPLDYWLHRLFLDLLKNKSRQGYGSRDEGGMIFLVCQASATYCLRLKKEAVETETDTPPEHRRERGPDIGRSKERVAFEDGLRSELATLSPLVKKYTAVETLQKRYPKFELWKVLSDKEQQELLTESFKPRAYARTLTTRKFAVTKWAIEKDRPKLRGHK